MIVLHLIRGANSLPVAVVGAGDWVVRLGVEIRLESRGALLPPGSLDHDQLVVLIAAADRVVTW